MNINNNFNKNFFLKKDFCQNQTKKHELKTTTTTNQKTKKLNIDDYLKDVDFISLAQDEKNSRINYKDLPNGVSRFDYKGARYTIYRHNDVYKSEFYYPKDFDRSEFFRSYSSLKPECIDLSNNQTSSIEGINGEIDETVMQGGSGDCWILSALNSFASVESGKQIIKDSIKVNDDNTVTVIFNGLGVSYTLTADEIKRYDTDNNTEDKYSNGDNDALVIEMATEKLIKDINSGKIKISTENENISETERNISDGGFPSRLVYYLTGIESTEYYEDTKNIDSDKIYEILDEAYKSGNYSITFGLYDSIHTAKLIDGSSYEVDSGGGHALSVKNITSDTVTIVNPWDSSLEYTMSYSEFANLGIGYLSVADLSKTQYKEDITDMTGYTPGKTIDEDNRINTDDNKTDIEDNKKINTDNEYQYYDWEFDYDFNPRNYDSRKNRIHNNGFNVYSLLEKVMSFLNNLFEIFSNQSSNNDYFYLENKNNQRL